MSAAATGLDAIGFDGAADGPVQNEIGSIAEWPACHPQQILAQLHKVVEAEKGQNKKGFWSSYPKEWSKLSDEQRNKCRVFFTKLDAATKTRILERAKTATEASGAGNVNETNGDTRSRAPCTTKHEAARLMHILKDPLAAAHWSQIHRPMDRPTLDSRNSVNAPGAGGRSMAAEGNGWIRLTEMFNDKDLQYQNATIQYRTDRDGKAVKLDPWRPRSDAIMCIAASTYEIDPNVFNQRDEVWMKDTYGKLKAGWTKLTANFTKSGLQNNDGSADLEWKSTVDEVLAVTSEKWVSMSTNITRTCWPDAMAYSYVLLDEDDFKHIVRLLPGHVGRDGDAKGDGDETEEERRKRRKLEKEKRNGNKGGEGMAQIIAAEGEMENRRQLWSILLQHGTAEDKNNALQSIRAELQKANVSSSSSSASSGSSASSRENSFSSEGGMRHGDDDDGDDDGDDE